MVGGPQVGAREVWILDISEEQLSSGTKLDLVVLVWIQRSCSHKELEYVFGEEIGVASFECGHNVGIDHCGVDVEKFAIVAQSDSRGWRGFRSVLCVNKIVD